jgi:peptidoglycan hydrolase-like protein with peptidoglycan-binding domain
MKKTLVTLLGIALFSLAGASQVSALTADDLASKIQTLMAQIATLQEQIKMLQNTPVQSPVPIPAEAPSSCKVWYDGCNTCTREYPGGPLSCTEVQCIWNAGSKCTAYFDTQPGGTPRICTLAAPYLRRGFSGEEVAAVQEFLAGEGFLKAQATGYFGAATEAALKEWQSQQGIVSGGSAVSTGWGTVGQRTWESLKRRCVPVPPLEAKLSAYPQRGTAPLTVEFKAQVNPMNDNIVADAGYYKIAFGDGAEYTFPCTDPSGTCRPPSTSHTYTSNGTYVAKLVHYGFFGPVGANEVVMGKVEIVVGEGVIGCTKEYAPVCGRPSGCANTCPSGMYCTMMCRLNDPQTYSNKCMLKAAGAEYLYDGVCANTQTNKPPTIAGLMGPSNLTVRETGTWSITASGPENQSLSYSVTWGDEYAYPMAMMDRAVSSAVFYQDTTFTHSYATAGTYTITIVVTDAAGQSAKTSTTVRVGSDAVACTMEYAPVCGKPAYCLTAKFNNSGPAWATHECNIGKTYSNRCSLDSENAVFIGTGTCSPSPVACTMEYAPVCGQKTVCPACTSSNPPCMAAFIMQVLLYVCCLR